MPLVRKRFLYKEVLSLRKHGKSYREISKKLNLPRSTISCWLANKKWSQNIKRQLDYLNRKRSSNFLTKINRVRHLQTIEKYEGYRKEAQKEYSQLILDKLFLIGLAIYWGEGEKTDSGRVSVVNSDVNMMKLIMSFYRKSLMIPEEKLRIALFIYQDIDEAAALRYWSRNLRIGKDHFIKTQVLPSRSKLTQRKVKYGMCNAYFTSIVMSVKIKEWLNLLASDMRV